MRKNFQLATTCMLTGSVLFLSNIAAFSQSYSPSYNSGYGSNSGYGGYQPSYSSNYQPNYQKSNYAKPLQGRVVIVPSGTVFSASTTADITSENLQVGDTVTLTLGNDFIYNGTVIAPAGSSVFGNVQVVKRGSYGSTNGSLKIGFTNIVTPQGQRIPISGKVATDDGTGMLKGGTAKSTAATIAKNTAVGAGLGALSGVIFGPLSGGKAGKGAALGTAVGAGLGAGKAMINRGNNAEIPANSYVDIRLDQPVTITPQASYNY